MAEADREADPGRRRFLGRVSIAVAGVVAVAATIPFFGYFFRPARGRARVWRDVGGLADFRIGEMRKVIYPDPDPDPWEGVVVRNAAWVRREAEDSVVAFSIYCTHTGCPVNWVDQAGFFLCPCHGGIFDREGDVTAGPPPRPLDRAPVRIRDGRIEIQAIDIPTPD